MRFRGRVDLRKPTAVRAEGRSRQIPATVRERSAVARGGEGGLAVRARGAGNVSARRDDLCRRGRPDRDARRKDTSRSLSWRDDGREQAVPHRAAGFRFLRPEGRATGDDHPQDGARPEFSDPGGGLSDRAGKRWPGDEFAERVSFAGGAQAGNGTVPRAKPDADAGG